MERQREGKEYSQCRQYKQKHEGTNVQEGTHGVYVENEWETRPDGDIFRKPFETTEQASASHWRLMNKELKCQNIVSAPFSFVLDEVGKLTRGKRTNYTIVISWAMMTWPRIVANGTKKKKKKTDSVN